jgi:hypothetical protein
MKNSTQITGEIRLNYQQIPCKLEQPYLALQEFLTTKNPR